MGELISRRFSQRVPADTRLELTTEVLEDATVERVDIRFYPGPRLTLELRPFVETKRGNRFDLIDLVGRDVIVGDNDVLGFDISEPVSEGAKIGVVANNTDPENEYDFNVDIQLDRTAGQSRLLSEVFG